MKKRMLSILLSALLAANINACNYKPNPDIEEKLENTDIPGSNFEETYEKNPDIEETLENTDTPGSNFEETDEKTTESKPNAEKRPPRKGPAVCNGVLGNSEVTYTFSQNGELSVNIASWDESHLVTSLADEDLNAVKYTTTSICVNNERAFLLLRRSNKITVVSFEKGSQGETVVNLDADDPGDEIGTYEIGGNFINENVGYLFAFKEVSGYSRGGSKLSNLFKTEDGGNTWNSINVQSVPSISLRNDIMFAKMISEDVGLISGDVFAADYDFCTRTLLTTDGGLNWVYVNIPELPQEDDLEWAKVADFTQVDGSYILTIRYGSETDCDYAQYKLLEYKLLDLNTWIRIS